MNIDGGYDPIEPNEWLHLCPVCFAAIPDDYRQSHTQWHIGRDELPKPPDESDIAWGVDRRRDFIEMYGR